jgi:hypothetical protein
MQTFVKLAAICISVLVLFNSCSKEKDENTDKEKSSEKLIGANVTAESFFEDANNEVMITSQENVLLSTAPTREPGTGTIAMDGITETNGVNGCASVTINPMGSTFPKTVTIDYGEGGCAGTFGIKRKGKIIYTISDRFSKPGSSISVSFEGYKVNDHSLQGIYLITNTTTGFVPAVTTQVTAGKLTYPDGSFYTYSGSRAYVQTGGLVTTSILDDELSISGNNTISNSEGEKLTATTKTDLLKKYSCRNLVSGIVDFDYNGIKGVWNYGSGDCDNIATVVIGNWTGTVTLP